jgi:hypothetical protein
MNDHELLAAHEMLLARAAGVARRLPRNPSCAVLPDTFAPKDGATLRIEDGDAVLEWWIGGFDDCRRIQTGTSFPATLLDPYSQHGSEAASISDAMKRRPISPHAWWAARIGATVAAFAYILLLGHDWPGHPVIAVVAVYLAMLSLLIAGRRTLPETKSSPISTDDGAGRK